MYQITLINGTERHILHTDDPDSTQRITAGKLKEYVGSTPSVTLTVTPQNACYHMLHDRSTEITLKNTETGEIEFEGYLLKSPESMTNKGTLQKKLTFEGFLGFLNDSVQMYHTYDNASPSAFLQAVLDYHNATTEAGKHIYLGEIDAGQAGSKTTAYRSTLAEIKENLVNRFGGELRVRRGSGGKLYLDYLTAATNGGTSDIIVDLGFNLRSLSIESDTANIITRLIPLGTQLSDSGDSAERLTIIGAVDPDDGHTYTVPYIDDAEAIARYGVIAGTAEFDDITVKENLVSRGKDYLAENNRVKKHYAASVLDISGKGRIRCGDTYRFRNRMMGLDENLRLLGRTVDLLKPYTPDVEIGDKTAKITSITAKTQHLVDYEIPQQFSQTVQNAKRAAESMIMSATGGYITLVQNQDGTGTAALVISDVPYDQITNAHNVWIWNTAGLCHATSYPPSGHLNAAITMDGRISADYITTGKLSADYIQGGTLVVGGANNDNGQISVRNANNTEIVHIDQNGLYAEDSTTHMRLAITDGCIHGIVNGQLFSDINPSVTFELDGQSVLGMLLRAPLLFLQADNISTEKGGSVYAAKDYSIELVKSVTLNQDPNTGDYSLTVVKEHLQFVNGLLVDYWEV